VDSRAVHEASWSTTLPGFKRSVRQNIVLPIAETVCDSVTRSGEAPKLRTESGELSDDVSIEQLDEVPVLQIGAAAGTAGLRNEYSLLELTPGTSPNISVRVNGMPRCARAFPPRSPTGMTRLGH
jgi:hypothetical protein